MRYCKNCAFYTAKSEDSEKGKAPEVTVSSTKDLRPGYCSNFRMGVFGDSSCQDFSARV